MKRRWGAGEIEEVAQRYEAEGPYQLSHDLRRSVHSVTGIATRLSLRSLTRRLRQALSRTQKRLEPCSQRRKSAVELLIVADTVPAA
jgi:hypothetical protein